MEIKRNIPAWGKKGKAAVHWLFRKKKSKERRHWWMVQEKIPFYGWQAAADVTLNYYIMGKTRARAHEWKRELEKTRGKKYRVRKVVLA